VAILLLLIFGWLTGACVWEVYDEGEQGNVQAQGF
jgi:hypothetical protein